MKNKLKILLVLAFINLLFCGVYHSQSLNVNTINGNNGSYAVSDVRKITIENSNLIVSLYNGSSFSYNLSSLSNYTYNESSVQNLISLTKEWNIKIYPNPSQNIFTLEYNINNAQNIGIVIKDLFGKELKKQDIGNQPPGEYKKDISLEEFSAGTYILEIHGNNYSYISKINKF
ncbi:MAG: T9SS C-terminal target domain-containing protein [Flavobacteriales bacterium]|jgi:hypothetical protein|nr:T9SS C-terminal target domain-containing protein [Flavobacteriales bacterium]